MDLAHEDMPTGPAHEHMPTGSAHEHMPMDPAPWAYAQGPMTGVNQQLAEAEIHDSDLFRTGVLGAPGIGGRDLVEFGGGMLPESILSVGGHAMEKLSKQ